MGAGALCAISGKHCIKAPDTGPGCRAGGGGEDEIQGGKAGGAARGRSGRGPALVEHLSEPGLGKQETGELKVAGTCPFSIRPHLGLPDQAFYETHPL